MTGRKKKLRYIQFFLLILGIIIIYLTYYSKNTEEKNIISEKVKEEITKEKSSGDDTEDLFTNIEYFGLDRNGNRYLLKSEEASLDKTKAEIVYMKIVHAIFYFKDDTILYIWSDKAIYNNKTLDMKFDENVKATYLDTKLYAQKAEYSNSDSFLSIQGDVKVDNKKGNLIADKLLFDITKQKLEISSFQNGKINANVRLDEKRF